MFWSEIGNYDAEVGLLYCTTQLFHLIEPVNEFPCKVVVNIETVIM